MVTTIQYKGEVRELRVTNATMMRFARLGGDLQAMERDPVGQSVTMACAALALQGDPIDHADDLPPLRDLAPAITAAVQAYMGDADEPGEPTGGADVPGPVSPGA